MRQEEIRVAKSFLPKNHQHSVQNFVPTMIVFIDDKYNSNQYTKNRVFIIVNFIGIILEVGG